MALVEASELNEYLQRTVAPSTAAIAIGMAEAWLRPRATNITWPPTKESHPDLWAAGVELAAIAVENPTGMRSTTVAGGQTDEWNLARRAEILDEVSERYGGTAPLFSFPPAPPEQGC